MYFELFFLVFAHYLADVGFMNQWLYDLKHKSKFVLFAHCVIWTGCISIVLLYFGHLEWWKIIFLLAGHFVIDLWKSYKVVTRYAKPVDEICHIIQLIIVWIL